MFTNGLSDLGFIGDHFTWSNNHASPGEIKFHLDRMIASTSWRITYQNAMVFHEEKIGSDHCPIRLDLFGA
ncbi:hypothetical protein LINPERHAP2_LOCUS963 [Linum perenne]